MGHRGGDGSAQFRESLGEALGQALAVGVVDVEDAGALVALFPGQAAQHDALRRVGHGGAEQGNRRLRAP